MHLHEGDPAPDFTGIDQHGKTRTLSDYQRKWVLLYFYPKDDTTGCTKEACGFRDKHAESDGKLSVIGISKDSASSHQKFIEKYQLPFTLLSDPDQTIITAYGALPEALGKRVSFLISPEGKIAKIYTDIDCVAHAAEVMEDLQVLV